MRMVTWVHTAQGLSDQGNLFQNILPDAVVQHAVSDAHCNQHGRQREGGQGAGDALAKQGAW